MRFSRSRAGRYAEQQYREGLRAWRVKIRWILAVVAVPIMVAAIVVLVVDKHRLSWVAGVFFGGCVCIWLVMRDTPPGYVENWRDGFEGERKTEKALEPLERSGWRIVHDIESRYGNYDHVAIGPGGVFVLETKNPTGVVEMREGVPIVQRRLLAATYSLRKVRGQALGAAWRLHDEITTRTGETGWVQGVVVFWAEFPDGQAEHAKCVFIHGSQLRAWLEARPTTLSTTKVEQITAAVTQLAE